MDRSDRSCFAKTYAHVRRGTMGYEGGLTALTRTWREPSGHYFGNLLCWDILIFKARRLPLRRPHTVTLQLFVLDFCPLPSCRISGCTSARMGLLSCRFRACSVYGSAPSPLHGLFFRRRARPCRAALPHLQSMQEILLRAARSVASNIAFACMLVVWACGRGEVECLIGASPCWH